jgi:hypothetical protein
MVYETSVGLNFTAGVSAGETIYDYPIPGISVGVPGLGVFGNLLLEMRCPSQ